jgi:hypothetical protein
MWRQWHHLVAVTKIAMSAVVPIRLDANDFADYISSKTERIHASTASASPADVFFGSVLAPLSELEPLKTKEAACPLMDWKNLHITVV